MEVWFRLKFRKAEVQPPFNEAVSYLMKKNLAYTLHLFYARNKIFLGEKERRATTSLPGGHSAADDWFVNFF